MALSTTDMGIKTSEIGLGAVRLHLNTLFEKGKGALELWLQDHMRAGISQKDVGDGAGRTQGRLPDQGRGAGFQQPAFFNIASTVIITVEVLALFSGGSSHGSQVSRVGRIGPLTRGAPVKWHRIVFNVWSSAGDIRAVARVDADGIALFDKIGYLNG